MVAENLNPSISRNLLGCDGINNVELIAGREATIERIANTFAPGALRRALRVLIVDDDHDSADVLDSSYVTGATNLAASTTGSQPFSRRE